MTSSLKSSFNIRFIAFLLITAVSLSLNSCSSDDDGDGDSTALIRLMIVNHGLVEFFEQGLATVNTIDEPYQVVARSDFMADSIWDIVITFPKTPGTYTVENDPLLFMTLVDSTPCLPSGDCTVQPQSFVAVEGSLTLEEASEERLRGSFEFRGLDPEADTELEIRGGLFDIPLN